MVSGENDIEKNEELLKDLERARESKTDRR